MKVLGSTIRPGSYSTCHVPCGRSSSGVFPGQVPGKPGEPEADADTDGGELGTERPGGAAHEREHPRGPSKKPSWIVECR